MTQFGKSFEEMCDFHYCLSACCEVADEGLNKAANDFSLFIERGTPETLAAVIALQLEEPLPNKNYFATAEASSSSDYSSAYRNESNFQKPCAFMSDVSGEGKTFSILFLFYCIDLYFSFIEQHCFSLIVHDFNLLSFWNSLDFYRSSFRQRGTMFVPWIFLDALGSPLISLGFPCVVLVCSRNIMGPLVFCILIVICFSRNKIIGVLWLFMMTLGCHWNSIWFLLIFI